MTDTAEGRKAVIVHSETEWEVIVYSLQTGEELSRQSHSAPPDAAQLKALAGRVGKPILEAAHRTNASGALDTVQSCVHSVPHLLLPPLQLGVGIYTNFGNSSVSQTDEIRPGDVCVCEDAQFQGGKSFQKYQRTLSRAFFVIDEWDGTKQKLRLAGTRKESLRLRDLRHGVVKVYRVTDVSYYDL